nr:MAG TPA: hypothetical protein [Caudoviricetes sp.]
MYREFNRDAEFCIVTPEEHEAFDKVIVPFLNHEVNQAFYTGDVQYDFQRATWVGPLQEKFGCEYLFCSKVLVEYETALAMADALKDRIRKENLRDPNYPISNVNMLNMFMVNQYLHSNCGEDNWNGWSRNEYMLEPCRKLLHDGAWVKWGKVGRIAFPITNLDANTGKYTMTFEYENLKEGEDPGDPAWKYNYAVFGVSVGVPRSSDVMEALRKAWPTKK